MPRITSSVSLGEVAVRFEEIGKLQEEVRGHIDAINDLYAKIAAASGSPLQLRRGPGRPAKSPAAGRPGNGARAPRGALKEIIHKVLAGGKVAGPAEVVKKVQAAGFKTVSNPKVFYTTVYIALSKDKTIEKTKEGFRLKATAKAAPNATPAKTTQAKATPEKTAEKK